MPENTQNKLLVKGDLSGIQEFIFNTKSKGAAKTLKGKSFYVQILADLAINCIKQEVDQNNVEVVYNGGGNFYLLVADSKQTQLKEAEKLIIKDLVSEGIFLVLTYIPYDNTKDYAANLIALNKKAQLKSLNRFEEEAIFEEVFSPSEKKDDTPQNHKRWKEMADQLLSSNSTYTETKFGQAYYFGDAENKIKIQKINSQVPRWTNQLIASYDVPQEELDEEELRDVRPNVLLSFNQLGYFAKKRTGSDNLAILKLDVDNLGAVIRNKKTEEDNKAFSKLLGSFFDEKVKELLQRTFTYAERGKPKRGGEQYEVYHPTVKYAEAIYVIFSGGDDCFMVGAWDAIFEFAGLLKKQFDEFVNRNMAALGQALTFSASLIIVDASFPVSQFSKLAEEALAQAKKNPQKNALSIFGKVVPWALWPDICKHKNSIVRYLMEYNVPRSLLIRLKQITTVYERLNEKQKLDLTTLTKFYYDLRDQKKRIATENTQATNSEKRIYEEELKKIIGNIYKDYLRTTLLQNQASFAHLLILPIAARWAEFSTRNMKS